MKIMFDPYSDKVDSIEWEFTVQGQICICNEYVMFFVFLYIYIYFDYYRELISDSTLNKLRKNY